MGINCSSAKATAVEQGAHVRKGGTHLESIHQSSKTPTLIETKSKGGHADQVVFILSADETPGSNNNLSASSKNRGLINSSGPKIINVNPSEEKVTPAGGSIGSMTTGDTSPRKLFAYKKGPMIGNGSSGEVYECLNLSTGELLAVKCIKLSGDVLKVQTYIDQLRKEIAVLKTLNHENIVKYYMADIGETKDLSTTVIDIVIEYVSGGSIRVLLEKFNKLDEPIVASYTRQILNGLHYLHFNGIIHRDIKGSNVLIDANGKIKLTDFGASKRIDKMGEEGGPPQAFKGSPYWTAPEVMMKKSQGKPSDIWSVGCVVIEMLTGSPPWANLGKNADEIIQLIISGTPPPFPKDISSNCRNFLYSTLKFRPEDRKTALELMEHPFIKEGEDNGDESFLGHSETFANLPSSVRPQINVLADMDHKNQEQYWNVANNNNLQQQNSNVSISGINFSRIQSGLTRGPSNEMSLPKLSTNENMLSPQSSQRSFTKEMSQSALRNIPIKELREEEEGTPTGEELQRKFFQPSETNTEADKTVEKTKEQKRKEYEEMLQKELMNASGKKKNIEEPITEPSKFKPETKPTEDSKKNDEDEDAKKKAEKRRLYEMQLESELQMQNSKNLSKVLEKKESRIISEEEGKRMKADEARRKWEAELEKELNGVKTLKSEDFEDFKSHLAIKPVKLITREEE